MKKLGLATKILAVVLISAIAFVGIYTQKQNRMINIVKDYDLGMDLKGSRVVTLAVSDETEEITKDKDGNIVEEENKQENGEYTTEKKPVNPDEVKTLDNYKLSKKIIEKRLKNSGVNDYIIRMDDDSGKIVVEIPENSNTDKIVGNISEAGKFEIVDSEDTDKVLMSNADIKKSNVLYNTAETGTIVYLNIEFNKEGSEKLKNISTEYATKSEDTSSNESSSEEATESTETTAEGTTAEGTAEESKQKQIIMQIDGNKMVTTSFDETMENGSIQLSMGQATTDREKLDENVENANTIATLLDTGNLPIEYKTDGNEYIESDITNGTLIMLAKIAAIIAAFALIALILRNKKYGLLISIAYIGFVALYLLLLRYANVTITLEGIAAIAVILTMNYVFSFKLLTKIQEAEDGDRNKALKDSYKSFCIKAIPIVLLSIVFCFVGWMPISSFGMTMFWGLALMAIYNITATKSFVK